MNGIGEVIQLMPGGGSARRDLSPIAQPPDVHDVIAHTPDPSSYHVVNGRTMIPRHSGQFGGSRGFSTKPGVVNVDPTDPISGKGGLTVDLEAVSKADYAYAAGAADGNPLTAWSIAASRQKQASQAVAPRRQTPSVASAYPVVQGGEGSPMQYVAAAGTPAANPSVKPRKNTMSATTQSLPPAWESSAAQGAAATTHPSQLLQAQPAAAQATAHPLRQSSPLQHGQIQEFHGLPYAYNADTNSWDLQQQEPLAPPPPPLPPPPPPRPVPPPTTAWQSPPTQPTVLADALSLILQELKSLRMDKEAVKVKEPEPVVEEPQQGKQNWEQRIAAADAPVADNQGDTYADIDMPWLGRQPAAPKLAVIFRMPAGLMRTRYHFAVQRGICLSLISDSRYDGEQFIPAETEEGQTIKVQIPALKIDVEVMVFDYHCSIGCLDILNLIIVDRDKMAGPPVMTADTELELSTFARKGAL